jgi:hypothetical protein
MNDADDGNKNQAAVYTSDMMVTMVMLMGEGSAM